MKNTVEVVDPGRRHGSINVTIPNPANVRSSVEDRGPGIPERVEVFRPFETTKAHGSVAVFSLLERSCWSTEAALRLSLDSHTERSFRSTVACKSQPCQALRVLLVDADECFRSGLAENLRDDGHEVCEYAVPAEVPSLATRGAVDIAVLDYSTPSAEHLALADTLHRIRPAIPVVLITAYCSDADDGEAATRPFLHLQARPLDYEVLHGLIHRLCHQATT